MIQAKAGQLTPQFAKVLEAKPHTPVYMMHKYFARRPWNVFNELISRYSRIGDVVLDPFCGGGVTVVESLRLRRRVIGVDVNPLATYVTEMESRPADVERMERAFRELSLDVKEEISKLYSTQCTNCGKNATADWTEWDEVEQSIVRLKFDCPFCGASKQKKPDSHDAKLAREIDKSFSRRIEQKQLWFPTTGIPEGDKTNSLLKQKVNSFHELFTRRNLLALALLLKHIEAVKDSDSKDLLRFAFSSSLKWASRQSHLRGEIVEGWALHAYWIYPKSLEINAWNTFSRRTQAVLRGKKYGNDEVGTFAKPAKDFDDIATGSTSYLILNQSASSLPLPDNSVDMVMTDPPYGGNVNYAELSDYWYIWLDKGKLIEKKNEVIVNRTQSKSLTEYRTGLYEVFKECYRVLKPERYLISTFNSKDMRVVAAFIIAASRAGFTLPSEGVTYQKPIRSYTTTFHAMQIGAFVGDFIFAFIKQPKNLQSTLSSLELNELKQSLNEVIGASTENELTEPVLRQEAYSILIPFVASHACNDMDACVSAANFFEDKVRELEPYLKEVRQTMTRQRRDTFRKRRRA